jgi:hypothetical protein
MLALGVGAWSLVIAVALLAIAVPTLMYTRRSAKPRSIEAERKSVPAGPDVSVSAHMGVPVPDGPPLAGIEAANVGALATTIQGWGFEIERAGGSQVVDPFGGYLSPSVPYRLASHDSASFRMELVPMLASVLPHTGGRSVALIPFVRVATGRVRGEAWTAHEDWWNQARALGS